MARTPRRLISPAKSRSANVRNAARAFSMRGMNYLCEKATGPDKTCTFKTGKIILQQPIEAAQVKKMLETGKTDLLTKFISKKNNRAFKAFLVIKDGGTAFEFAPREKKGKGEGRNAERAVAEDWISPVKKSSANVRSAAETVFDTEAGYICENSQREPKRCTFKSIGKTILEQPIDAVQAKKILADGKSRFAGQIHFQSRQAVSGVSGDGRKRQNHLRFSAERIDGRAELLLGQAAQQRSPSELCNFFPKNTDRAGRWFCFMVYLVRPTTGISSQCNCRRNSASSHSTSAITANRRTVTKWIIR